MSEPAKFTRDNRVDKVAIWNCFFDIERGRLDDRMLVNVRAKIGLNAPKYLIAKQYAQVYMRDRADWMTLTLAGKDWLTKGLESLLKRHPEREPEVYKVRGVIDSKQITRIRRGW